MQVRPLDIDGHAVGVACIALLVALAGCAGPTGGGNGEDAASPEGPSGAGTDAPTDGDSDSGATTAGDGDTTAGDGDTTTGDAATTADEGATATPDAATATPDAATATDAGTATAGSGGASDVLSRSFVTGWAQHLRSEGSFTAEMSGITVTGTTGEGDSEPPLVNWTMKVDLSTGERYANGTVTGGSGGSIPVELYHPPSSNTTYTRTTFRGRSQVSQSNATNNRGEPVPAGLLNTVRLTRDGTGTVDGDSLQRYTGEGSDAIVNQSYFDGSVTDLRVEALVDRDAGLVRVIDYRYEVTSGDTTTTQSLRIRYTDIGDTTVERPDWMDGVGN
ncbi:DUF7537 family lipoprotein [Halosimplex marinum]|uniref:DUF7537 family lipoprotein n=1 Tax=Halosimplex marinum TaxID=3396620 RepID=UPI003F54F8CF